MDLISNSKPWECIIARNWKWFSFGSRGMLLIFYIRIIFYGCSNLCERLSTVVRLVHIPLQRQTSLYLFLHCSFRHEPGDRKVLGRWHWEEETGSFGQEAAATAERPKTMKELFTSLKVPRTSLTLCRRAADLKPCFAAHLPDPSETFYIKRVFTRKFSTDLGPKTFCRTYLASFGFGFAIWNIWKTSRNRCWTQHYEELLDLHRNDQKCSKEHRLSKLIRCLNIWGGCCLTLTGGFWHMANPPIISLL